MGVITSNGVAQLMSSLVKSMWAVYFSYDETTFQTTETTILSYEIKSVKEPFKEKHSPCGAINVMVVIIHLKTQVRIYLYV